MDRGSKQSGMPDGPKDSLAPQADASRTTQDSALAGTAWPLPGIAPPRPLNGHDAVALVPDELVPFLDTNEAEGRQQFQRSLDLFEGGMSILESGNDLLLKKGSQRIRSETSLNLLQKKLFNALMFVARPTLSREGVFSVPVDYMSWCVNHDRADMTYLKDSLLVMKQVVIEVESGHKWFMTSLLADAMFDGKHLGYELP